MPTLSELKTRIRDLIDTEDQDFVTDAEETRYINEAIKEVESDIHNLYEDYFLTSTNLSVTAGVSEYSLPSDIFARKIRKILFDNGSDTYEIKPILSLEKTLDVQSYDEYKYIIINSAASGVKIKFYPTIATTSSTAITMFYIRDAKQLSSSSDELDIPEFEKYIIDLVRYRIIQKDIGNPMLTELEKEVYKSRQLMIDTLQKSIPDENHSVIEKNLDFYDEFEYDFY